MLIDLKSMARDALANCNAFAEAANKTDDGKSQSYRKISEAYNDLARLIIGQMNIEADERQKP